MRPLPRLLLKVAPVEVHQDSQNCISSCPSQKNTQVSNFLLQMLKNRITISSNSYVFFHQNCLLNKAEQRCFFCPIVFLCFFSLDETSKRFPFIFFHSTFSRSKRQSKKRSRARQSDARSSVGPEDCQRRS